MRYLSVCSGVEAATVAWHDLGWEPVAFSEIEKFPSQVLQHHYPDVPNLGDMTNFKEWNLNESIDILVGGTPCQSFSIAGLRQGLQDPRGNLMLTYLGILDKFRPKWCVWENVPGVLSSNGGRDFGSFLGALGELGYGFAYRVLDAQNFGVAQRRRRVFVVGCLGDWRSAAEVLFEPESLCRDSKKSRETREETSNTITTGIGSRLDGQIDQFVVGSGTNPELMSNLNASDGQKWGCNQWVDEGKAVLSTVGALCARDYKGVGNQYVAEGKCIVYENHPADSRVTEMGETCSTVAARWGTGGGNVPFAVKSYALQGSMIGRAEKNGPQGDGVNEDISFTLNTTDRHAVAHTYSPQAIGHIIENDLAGCITKNSGGGGETQNPAFVVASTFKIRGGCEGGGKGYLGQDEKAFTISTVQDQNLHHHMAVRRLTPVECERLQGFPDGYTDIQLNGKQTPDGGRYKALGNSMAVPVMAWIGKRIQRLEEI
jgi:DNA (cytosine-5)-methyltransferase 1